MRRQQIPQLIDALLQDAQGAHRKSKKNATLSDRDF